MEETEEMYHPLLGKVKPKTAENIRRGIWLEEMKEFDKEKQRPEIFREGEWLRISPYPGVVYCGECGYRLGSGHTPDCGVYFLPERYSEFQDAWEPAS